MFKFSVAGCKDIETLRIFPYKFTKLAALLLPELFVTFEDKLLSIIPGATRWELGRLKKEKENRKKEKEKEWKG